MALQGTLKDFGIADILQLIGQQGKTGQLCLANKEQEVNVFFKDGNIVRVESVTRKKKDLIGNMLVRAEVITETQLEEALETQRRTLKRLGDVLVSGGAITADRFKKMMQLQATETIYRLFSWDAGTYEFKVEPVENDTEAITPLRAESVLMEGFRMVDEWPVIRKKINRYEMTFEVLKPLPPPVHKEEDLDAAFDDAFAEKKKDENKGEFKSVGDSERIVYEKIGPGRDVRKLIDVSCLGEFETCKALLNLINLEYARPIYPDGRAPTAEGSGILRKISGGLGRLGASMLALGAILFVVAQVSGILTLANSPAATFADPAAQRFISRAQVKRIEAALEIFRLEKGEVPEKLDALVEAGLLKPEELRYPWREQYYYRRVAAREFVLLPPMQ
jgi:competence protein ComGC